MAWQRVRSDLRHAAACRPSWLARLDVRAGTACIIEDMGDGGSIQDESGSMNGSAEHLQGLRWLRASGRAVKRTVTWILDRIGFLGV